MKKYSFEYIAKNSNWDFNKLKVVSVYRMYNGRVYIDFYKDQDRKIDSLIIEENISKKDLLNLILDINNHFEGIIFSVFNSENLFGFNHYVLKKLINDKNTVEDFFVTLIFSNVCSSNNGESFEEFILNKNIEYKEIDFHKVKKFLLDSFTLEFGIKGLNNESSLIGYFLCFVEHTINDGIFTIKDQLSYLHSGKNKGSKIEMIERIKPSILKEIEESFDRNSEGTFDVTNKKLEELLDLSSIIKIKK